MNLIFSLIFGLFIGCVFTVIQLGTDVFKGIDRSVFFYLAIIYSCGAGLPFLFTLFGIIDSYFDHLTSRLKGASISERA